MAKKNETFRIEDNGARCVLRESIFSSISIPAIQQTYTLNRRERDDAIEQIIKEAVSCAPIVSFSGVPHVFDEEQGIYVKFDFHEFELAIYDAMRKAKVPNGCYGNVMKIIRLCWAEAQSRKYSIDNSIVVFNNCVYDTMDCSVNKYSPKYLTNMKVDYPYNPMEVPVMWNRFLDEVLPEKDMQQLLQEFLAASYIDRSVAKFEHMMILLGNGSNGKSVIFEVVQALLGSENISNFSIRDLISSSRADQNIAMCNGKRLNYCSEIRTTEIGDRNSDAFKGLVSGEAQMARSLYKEPFRATEIPIIMANANKLPRLSDASFALQRRILIIPFNTTIPEDKQDKELARTLKTELSGIFNWVMEGLQKLRSNNYKPHIPEKVKQVVDDYVKENNSIKMWLDAKRMFAVWNPSVKPRPSFNTLASVYTSYMQWTEENGYERKDRSAFKEAMRTLGFDYKRRGDGYGFMYYESPSDEEVRVANMDIAISMQSRSYIEALKAASENMKEVKVTGVEDLERYLGLPDSSVWPYIQSGQLGGTFETSDGRMIFNVQMVQQRLAECGFYETIANGNKNYKRKASTVLRSMRVSFNKKMKKLGLPIRKYGNVHGYVPTEEKDCFIVPDDWEYTKRAAELVLAQRRENMMKLNIKTDL